MTTSGVWDLQQVRDKQLQSEWSYSSDSDPGSLWQWGYNTAGQLGQNDRSSRSSPTQVGTEGTWLVMSCWQNETGGVKEDGTLWTWGTNEFGHLGQNNKTQYSSPTQVGTNTNWATVYMSNEFCMGVKTDGTFWQWGLNSSGIRGTPADGMPTQRSSPIQMPGTNWSSEVGKFATGPGGFIGAIKTDGTLWCWGKKVGGSLGQNNNTTYTSPRQVGTGTDWLVIGGREGANMTNIKAIKTDGTMWTWGQNYDGQAGLNYITAPSDQGLSSPVQIPGTNWSTYFSNTYAQIFAKTDGSLWSWGTSYAGSLDRNVGGNYKRSSPAQIGTDTTWFAGSGSEAVVGTKTDGTLWTWGPNGFGTLAQNDRTARSSPTQVGTDTDWMSGSIRAIGANMIARRFA